MSDLKFIVDAAKCIQCDACVRDCIYGIIRRDGGAPTIPKPPEDTCLECQHCLAVCPTGAVSIFGLKPENSLPLKPGSFPSRQQMKALVRGRRSVRQFKDENVPAALVDELLADLAHAPTGCNDRDLEFIVLGDKAATRRLRETVVSAIERRLEAGDELHEFIADAALDFRRDGTDGFFRGAPHLLLATPGERAACGAEDAVLALAYFELLAQTAGLGTTWCGMLKFVVDSIPELRETLGLAPNAYFYTMMFGLPAVTYARTAQRDNAARIRRL